MKSFPPLKFKLTVKGVEEMNYRIEKKDAFRVVGVSRPLYKEIEKNFAIVPKMWQDVAVDGTINQLAGMMDMPLKGILGVCGYNTDESMKYIIGVASSMGASDGLEEYAIPAFTWAVFPGEAFGPPGYPGIGTAGCHRMAANLRL